MSARGPTCDPGVVTETPGRPLPPAGWGAGPSGPTGPGDAAPSGTAASPLRGVGEPVTSRPGGQRPGPIPAALLALGARPATSAGSASGAPGSGSFGSGPVE